MKMDVCIKNVNDDDWRMFKVESAKHGMKMGDFFNKIVIEHKENCSKSNWNKVLYGKNKLKGLLVREDLKKTREEFRKNFKLREIK